MKKNIRSAAKPQPEPMFVPEPWDSIGPRGDLVPIAQNKRQNGHVVADLRFVWKPDGWHLEWKDYNFQSFGSNAARRESVLLPEDFFSGKTPETLIDAVNEILQRNHTFPFEREELLLDAIQIFLEERALNLRPKLSPAPEPWNSVDPRGDVVLIAQNKMQDDHVIADLKFVRNPDGWHLEWKDYDLLNYRNDAACASVLLPEDFFAGKTPQTLVDAINEILQRNHAFPRMREYYYLNIMQTFLDARASEPMPAPQPKPVPAPKPKSKPTPNPKPEPATKRNDVPDSKPKSIYDGKRVLFLTEALEERDGTISCKKLVIDEDSGRLFLVTERGSIYHLRITGHEEITYKQFYRLLKQRGIAPIQSHFHGMKRTNFKQYIADMPPARENSGLCIAPYFMRIELPMLHTETLQVYRDGPDYQYTTCWADFGVQTALTRTDQFNDGRSWVVFSKRGENDIWLPENFLAGKTPAKVAEQVEKLLSFRATKEEKLHMEQFFSQEMGVPREPEKKPEPQQAPPPPPKPAPMPPKPAPKPDRRADFDPRGDVVPIARGKKEGNQAISDLEFVRKADGWHLDWTEFSFCGPGSADVWDESQLLPENFFVGKTPETLADAVNDILQRRYGFAFEREHLFLDVMQRFLDARASE